MDENTDKSVISWPLDPTTQQSLRRWLNQEPDVNYRYIVWRVLDNANFQSVGTKFGGDFEIPFGGILNSIYVFADTAGTTGTATVDVNVGGNTILSTKITIDSTEKTSRTAATPPVISDSDLTVADIITVDIDAIQTTPAKGLTVVLVIST